MKSKMNKQMLLLTLGVVIIIWGSQIAAPIISLIGGWFIFMSNKEG